MKKRFLAMMLAVCMVLGTMPVTSFAASRQDTTNISDHSGYLSKCTPYAAYLVVEIINPTTLKSLPCSKGTNAESTDVYTPSIGEQFTVTKLFWNTAGNYWYETSCDGKPCYIFAGDAEVCVKKSGLTISDVVAPETLVVGEGFYIGGLITAQYTELANVGAVVSEENKILYSKDVTASGSYDLYQSEVGMALKFSLLPEGTYHYFLYAKVNNYYSVDGKELKVTSITTTLCSKDFTVVSGQCGDNVHWKFDESTGTLTIGGTGDMWDYEHYSDAPWLKISSSIKSVVIESGVTSISRHAFQFYYSLSSVVIPGSVTSIGGSAFYSCKSLSSVVIGNGVTSIGNSAFFSCKSLTSVSVPDSVTSIGNNAFLNCESLSSVVIPDGVTSIGSHAFSHCTSLSSVVIPDSVTSIGGYAFSHCTSLSSVVIPDSVTSIDGGTFSHCTSLSSVVIPACVTSIGDSAFLGCTSLTSVNIPDSMTSIGDHAFGNCDSLTEISVDPDNSNYSSDECGVLFNKDKTTLIQYPIGNSRTNYYIPDGVTSIGGYAFYGCTNLSSVVIPDSVTSIGGYAFSHCTSLSSVVIPDSVTSIGGGAFCGCTSLSSVVIPDSVTSIGGYAFYDCESLSSVVISCRVRSIGGYAFYDCTSLSSVYFCGKAPISIGDNLFPSGVILYYIPGTIGWTDSIYYDAENGTWKGYKLEAWDGPTGENVTSGQCGNNVYWEFDEATGTLTISGTGDMWDFLGWSSPWYSISYLIEAVIIGDGVTSIGMEAFADCNNMKSVKIPEGVTVVESWAFDNCSSLETVQLPQSLTYIGDLAFCMLWNMPSITIPSNVQYIGEGAFMDCGSLENVYFGGKVQYIGEGVFYACGNLKNVYFGGNAPSVTFAGHNFKSTFPDGVVLYYIPGTTGWTDSEYYDAEAGTWYGYKLEAWDGPTGENVTSGQCGDNVYWEFDEATGTLTISGTGDMWDYTLGGANNSPFSLSDKITTVLIENGVTSIGEFAFPLCTYLNDISIPNSVTTIGNCAFAACFNLTSIILPSSVTSIGDHAFGIDLSIPGFPGFDAGCVTDAYFEGDAPSIGDSSFNSDATLYYIPGTTGWTNNKFYDAEAGTWYGYKLKVWNCVELLECYPASICCDPDVKFAMQFNVPVSAANGMLRIKDARNNKDVYTVSTSELTIEGENVSFYVPDGVLEYGVSYYITIDSNAFCSGDIYYKGLSDKSVWTFTTNAEYNFPVSDVTLKWAQKGFLGLGGDDTSKPPYPDGSDNEYAELLVKWARAVGIENLDINKAKDLLDYPVYIPVTDVNGSSVLVYDGASTVRQVMEDIIFAEYLQPYIRELDEGLEAVEPATGSGLMFYMKQERELYEKVIGWYGQINEYFNRRGQSSNFFLATTAPIASAVLRQIVRVDDQTYSQYIKPILRGMISIEEEAISQSTLQNAASYEIYKEQTELVGTTTKCLSTAYKVFVEGEGYGIKLGADLLVSFFSQSDNKTMREISGAYQTAANLKTPIMLSMFLGSTIGLFPLVIDLYNTMFNNATAQVKSMYFFADYYMAENYPRAYELIIDAESGMFVDYSYELELNHSELRAETYRTSDPVMWNILNNWKYRASQYEDECVAIRRDLVNYNQLLKYIKYFNVSDAKAELARYIDAEINQGATTSVGVSCPVTVKVYDGDQLLATLSSESIEEFNDNYGSVYLLGENGETKYFVYDSDDYTVEIVPYAAGSMNITIVNDDGNGNVETKYFENVVLAEGDYFEINTITGDYLVKNGDEIIEQAATVPVKEVLLEGIHEIPVGSSVEITPVVIPAIATDHELTWSSSDESILTVEEGIVTGVSEGVATITATSENGVRAQIEICVFIPAETLTSDVSELELCEGDTVRPVITVFPSNASHSIYWSSSDISVASINEYGTIEAISEGEAVITAEIDGIETYIYVVVKPYTQGVIVKPEEPDNPDNPTEPDEPLPEPDPEISFLDVNEGDWFYDDVMYICSEGLMNGVGDNLFAPYEHTTRAMVVTILWRIDGETKVDGELAFADVPANEWYTDAIKWATSAGVVTGYDETHFGPNDYVTREQLAVMLYRYEKYIGGNVECNTTLSFADTDEIHSWAYDACVWCFENGIVNGKPGNLLEPLGKATRAELAAMFHRYIMG